MTREIAEVAREASALAEPDLRRAAIAHVAALIAATGGQFAAFGGAHVMLARSLGQEAAGPRGGEPIGDSSSGSNRG
jgi:hypothetical protein